MTDNELLYKVRERAIGNEFSERWCILELAKRYETAKAEIERLNIRNKALTDITKNYDWKFEKVKAEAIKEFWDKAKQTREFRTCPYVYILDGDNLLKEMVGDAE